MIAEMRRRGDQALEDSNDNVGDPVVSNFSYPVVHLFTRRGLLPFKACGGSYHSKHVEVATIVELSGVAKPGPTRA